MATDGECFACADSSRAIADWVVVILKCIAPPDLSEFDALLRQPTGSSTRQESEGPTWPELSGRAEHGGEGQVRRYRPGIRVEWTEPTLLGIDSQMVPTSSLDSPVLADIVRRLVAAYDPERIYLFGSMARGDAGPDSDYDVLVVVADDAEPERLASRRGYEALVGTGYAADILVWRKSAFDVRLPLKASLPATVAREGRLLYAA